METRPGKGACEVVVFTQDPTTSLGQLSLAHLETSSAALEVALLRALRAAFALPLDAVHIARLAQRAENDLVGAPVGIMDPMASSLACMSSALFLDTRSLAYELIPIPEAIELVGIDSGVPGATRPASIARGAPSASAPASCWASARSAMWTPRSWITSRALRSTRRPADEAPDPVQIAAHQ